MRAHKKSVEKEAYQSNWDWEKVEVNQLVCDKCGHVIEDSFEFKLKQSSGKKET
jgi:hypothetical protein